MGFEAETHYSFRILYLLNKRLLLFHQTSAPGIYGQREAEPHVATQWQCELVNIANCYVFARCHYCKDPLNIEYHIKWSQAPWETALQQVRIHCPQGICWVDYFVFSPCSWKQCSHPMFLAADCKPSWHLDVITFYLEDTWQTMCRSISVGPEWC